MSNLFRCGCFSVKSYSAKSSGYGAENQFIYDLTNISGYSNLVLYKNIFPVWKNVYVGNPIDHAAISWSITWNSITGKLSATRTGGSVYTIPTDCTFYVVN